MTQSDAPGISLGSLTADVQFNLDEAQLKRALDATEARLGKKIEVPLSVSTAGIAPSIQAVRVELDKLTGQTTKVSREQAAAARSLEQQYRATGAAQVAAARTSAAEAAASTAKIREQTAQLTLTTRLAAQQDREAAQATRLALQARREEIDQVRLAMARLRAAFDDGLTDEAAYQTANQKLITQLQQMGERADFTTRELKQLADMQARLAREGNTVAGVINPAGLSGNTATALQGVLPGLLAGLRQVVALSPSLGAAAAQVSGISQGFQEMAAASRMTGPAVAQLGQGANSAATAASFLGTGARGAGGAVSALGGAASVAGGLVGGLTVAVTAGAAAANKAANEYAKLQYSVAMISTLTDKAPEKLGSVQRGVLNISREIGMSYEDIARGVYDVLGAGVRGTEDLTSALNFTREAAMLAAAGMTDTATATDVLTSVMNAYSLTAEDTKRVSDGLFQAVKDGKMSFNDLAGSLGMVTAISAQAGVPLEQVLAALATMTANGIKASSAVDYLRSLIKAIVSPGEDAKKVFEGLGIAYGDNVLKARGLGGALLDIVQKTNGSTAQMNKLLGGVEAVTAATSIASGEFTRYKNNLDNQARSAGTTAEAYGKMADTIKKQNDQLKANWAALWASVGEVFAPIKSEILGGLNDMLNKANELVEKFLQARRLNGTGNNVLQLERDRGGLVDQLRAAERQLGDPSTEDRLRKQLAGQIEQIKAAIRDLDVKIAEAKSVQAQVRADAYGPQQGPQLPGSRTPTPTAAPTSDTNIGVYQSTVARVAAQLERTGVRTADEVVDYCAQWVRLTLGKADAKVAPIINKLFQTDSNKDGQITANDAANNVRAAGLMRNFTKPQDLKPGDVVFYEDGGAGHVGIYIGGGLVRGNNRVTYKETNGRTPVGNVALDRLGTVTGYARSDDLGGFKPQAAGASGGTGGSSVVAVTAAQITKAQQLLDRVTAAQKAAQAKPGDPALKVTYAKATAELEKWTNANEANAAAVKAVQETQAAAARGAGDYVASQADLATYGATALRLYKDLEQAQKSGDASRVASAERAIAAFVGESKVRKAVLDAETTAYKARQQAGEQAAARAKEQAQIRARYAAQARDLEVSEQQATLARVRTLNSAELDAFKGTQAQRVALIKRQAADEANAREQVARAVRDKAVREGQNARGPNMNTVIAQARQAYADEVQAARLAQGAANRAALDGEAQAVRQVRDAYGEAATALRDKIAAGQVDEEALTTYRKRIDDLAGAARAAGVAGNRFVTGAQASAEAVYQLAIDAQIASGAYDNVGDSYDRAARAGQTYEVTLERALQLLPDGADATDTYVRALEDLATQGKVSADTLNAVRQAIEDRTVTWELEAEQIARITTEGLSAADALAQVGDTEGAIDTLYGTLDGLYTRLENGEDVAAAIGQVVDRLNDLGNALELDTEFGTFVAGLGGMIDDQIAQVVDKLADPGTSAKLAAKLKVLLADLRQQLPKYPDAAAAGLIPGGNGFTPQVGTGADLDTITRARDLGTLLAETTDPAALQGVIAETTDLLASEAGKALSDGTRQGLEEGVTGAQEYLNILGSLTEEAVVDGFDRAAKGAAANPIPANEFKKWTNQIFQLGAEGLSDSTTMDALTQSLTDAREAGRLTGAELQNLLNLIEQLKAAGDGVNLGLTGRMKGNYDGLLTRGVDLEQARQAGEIDPIDAATQLRGLAQEAERYAAAAQAAGDTELAGQFRQIARGAREAAGALGKLMDVQQYLDWTAQLSGAFGDLAGAMGEVEQEYDAVTGEKLSTPWKDLAANLDGAQNAAKKLGAMITDVMRIMANPADIGAWISLITNVVSSIADAIAGFKKAQAEVAKLKQDFAQDNPLLNPGDYQKAYTRSRGFLADVFGGGPEIINEIDKIGLQFAKSIQEGLLGGIKNGMIEALKTNNFDAFRSTLRESTFNGLLEGMVDAFLKDELLKNILAPAIKAWSDALKTPDPADDAAALAGIDAAISQVDSLAERFYTDVAPKFADLQQKWGVEPSGSSSGPSTSFGGAPDIQHGAPRLTFPPEVMAGFTAFNQTVPEFRAGVAEWRQATAEFRDALAQGAARPAGLQRLSQNVLARM